MTAATVNLSQRFPRKRAFITGAASGLGLACAETLAREGWRLFLADSDEPRLGLVVDSLQRQGADVAGEVCDVRDAMALETSVGRVADAAGGIDVSIHSAGVAAAGPFIDTSEADWRWLFDVNVHGIANSCRAVVPVMQAQRGGLVVNVASAASFVTMAQMSAYNASKAAVVALSETLMQELAPYGIQIVAAMPGLFRTRLLESARGTQRTLERARRLMEGSGLAADVVAEALLTAAARGRTHFVYPSHYALLWRFKRLMPARFQRLLPRLLPR